MPLNQGLFSEALFYLNFLGNLDFGIPDAKKNAHI
jgi:hypothetical protein